MADFYARYQGILGGGGGGGGSGTRIQEVPAGTVNNSNKTFTLSQTPTSSASVDLYQDGGILTQGVDYTISSVTIAMTNAPNFGMVLYASYSY